VIFIVNGAIDNLSVIPSNVGRTRAAKLMAAKPVLKISGLPNYSSSLT
jgi:hypothetical protein